MCVPLDKSSDLISEIKVPTVGDVAIRYFLASSVAVVFVLLHDVFLLWNHLGEPLYVFAVAFDECSFQQP